MRMLALCLLVAALADPPAEVPARMRLKDGTVYLLKEPPFLKEGRFIFTTTEGKVYSIGEKDVDEIRLLGPTPRPRTSPNPQDSRALGAVARDERHKTGKHVPVSPVPTLRPRKDAEPS